MRLRNNILAVALTALLSIASFAQYTPTVTPVPLQSNAVVGPAAVVTNPSGLTISVSPGMIYCQGNVAIISGTQFTLFQNQTYYLIYNCNNDSLLVRSSYQPQGPVEVLLNTIVTGSSTAAVSSMTDNRAVTNFPLVTDATYIVPLNSIGLTVTTGALGTATAGTVNPGVLRVAANNDVVYALTTAATNAVALDADVTPPSKLTIGKGATINNIQVFYGVQTTALTSITSPTLSTVTYPASGAAAGATVAAAGGALTLNPVSLQLTTTTSGQCFSENISLATPVLINTDLQRLVLEQLFNQSAAAATQLQVCGVIVHYSYIPI